MRTAPTHRIASPNKKARTHRQTTHTPTHHHALKLAPLLPIALALLGATLALSYHNTTRLARHKADNLLRPYAPLERVACAPRHDERPRVDGCTPAPDRCGRLVRSRVASERQVRQLRAIAERAMALGGGAGGPTILDLQSGALSKDDVFIDVWQAFNLSGAAPLTKSEVTAYREVVDSVRGMVEATFQLEAPLYLTAPTFFSRISANLSPKTAMDEYWHTHIDTEQYEAFDYTTILYLSSDGIEHVGGQFVFDEVGERKRAALAPARGDWVGFSSGAEFPHHVEKVTSGVRYALTMAFSCSKEAEIADFLGRAVDDPA